MQAILSVHTMQLIFAHVSLALHVLCINSLQLTLQYTYYAAYNFKLALYNVCTSLSMLFIWQSFMVTVDVSLTYKFYGWSTVY